MIQDHDVEQKVTNTNVNRSTATELDDLGSHLFSSLSLLVASADSVSNKTNIQEI